MARLLLTGYHGAFVGLLFVGGLAVGCGVTDNHSGEAATSNGADKTQESQGFNDHNSGGSAGDATSAAGGGTSNSGGSGATSDANAGEPLPDPDGGSAGPDGAAASNPKAPSCNTKDPSVLYLSADDSNSMAGATVARGLIAQGQHVFKGLRTYEFLNYYHFDYAPASPGQLAVSAQLRKLPAGKNINPNNATTPSGSERYALQIAVRAPDFSVEKRRDAHLVLAVDTSSSMGWGPLGNTGFDRAQSACVALAASLRKGDHISMVTWGGAPVTHLSHYAIAKADDDVMLSACAKIVADGTTNLSAGLQSAYTLASKHFDPKKLNRVMLISDGGSNVGEQDEALIAKWAKAADSKEVTLMGVGVGDPWNYNDTLMNTVTDAGKGAYVFFDDSKEAAQAFGPAFMRHMEVAARDVQVQLTLPPSFAMTAFHGEQVSTNKDEVEPQHLAANDAMIFHQEIASCDPAWLASEGTSAKITVVANYIDPQTNKATQATFEASLSDLLKGDHLQLLKGDAIVAYAEALKSVRKLNGDAGVATLKQAIVAVDEALAKLSNDADLVEIRGLLEQHQQVFTKGQTDLYPTGGTGAKALSSACNTCEGTGSSLDNMACALDLCDEDVLLSQSYTSPTKSKTQGTFAAIAHYGAKDNDLAPKVGGAYAVMATGPALGTKHSENMGGQSMTDPFVGGASAYNAMTYTLKLKAPKGAGGFRLHHVFFSQEYDEYVGSNFNDKFYIILRAGSTNGGKPTVINYTKCRDPEQHHDFVCSPGMQFCNPRQRYCYIAINTAASECCWLDGCPNGKAKTNISGTGFSCASAQDQDTANSGSSTGWLTTEWPIEPGEVFEITFHVHDTGDGIYDSAVLLDGLRFVETVTPGTWSNMAL